MNIKKIGTISAGEPWDLPGVPLSGHTASLLSGVHLLRIPATKGKAISKMLKVVPLLLLKVIRLTPSELPLSFDNGHTCNVEIILF